MKIALILLSLNAIAMAEILTDKQYDRMTGPNGVAFVAVMSTISLWVSYLLINRQNRSDNLARETRERADRKEQVDKILEITEKYHQLTQRMTSAIENLAEKII